MVEVDVTRGKWFKPSEHVIRECRPYNRRRAVLDKLNEDLFCGIVFFEPEVLDGLGLI